MNDVDRSTIKFLDDRQDKLVQDSLEKWRSHKGKRDGDGTLMKVKQLVEKLEKLDQEGELMLL